MNLRFKMTKADKIKWKLRLKSIRKPFTYMVVFILLLKFVSFEISIIGILLYILYGRN